MTRPASIRRSLMGASLAGLAVLCGGCAANSAAPPIDAVFLIVVDTLRPDRLSCYGYTEHATPNIDALAASGVRFERAQSMASWTVPSMGSMLTSRYPSQLGLVESPPAEAKYWETRERRPQFRIGLPRGVPTMASLLDDAGYHPVAFVNQPLVNREEAFLPGFAEWCYSTGERSLSWHDPTTPIPPIDWPRRTDLGRADTLLIDAFDRWLEYKADLKPFVWLHLLKPHWPYAPAFRYLPEGVEPDTPVQPEVLYLAEVRETDDLVARVLDSIDKHVGLDRSLVVFTSDHGEEFGDHDMIEHGHSLHREVVRIPLIIAGPSVPRGKVIEAYVRSIDLLPTVLSLVGAEALIPADVEGRSLVPLAGPHDDPFVYQEGMLYGSTERSTIEDGYKLMFDGQSTPPYRLFDVGSDVLESTDLSAGEPNRVAAMRERLNEHHLRLVADFEALVGPEGVKLNPETERVLRAMRALGYVSD